MGGPSADAPQVDYGKLWSSYTTWQSEDKAEYEQNLSQAKASLGRSGAKVGSDYYNQTIAGVESAYKKKQEALQSGATYKSLQKEYESGIAKEQTTAEQEAFAAKGVYSEDSEIDPSALYYTTIDPDGTGEEDDLIYTRYSGDSIEDAPVGTKPISELIPSGYQAPTLDEYFSKQFATGQAEGGYKGSSYGFATDAKGKTRISGPSGGRRAPKGAGTISDWLTSPSALSGGTGLDDGAGWIK